MCLDAHMMTIHQQLEEARAVAQHEMLVAQLRTPWRVTVGRALVQIGERLAGARFVTSRGPEIAHR